MVLVSPSFQILTVDENYLQDYRDWVDISIAPGAGVGQAHERAEGEMTAWVP